VIIVEDLAFFAMGCLAGFIGGAIFFAKGGKK
jgi:hypothetical protein